jgi:fructokinase
VTDAATDFLEKTKAVFAITLGAKGTLLGLKGETQIIPSIPIKPVDTTGAGDAFTGAVLYQISDKTLNEIKTLTKEQWHNIIQNANKAGARTCEYLGAMEAFKHLSNDIFK